MGLTDQANALKGAAWPWRNLYLMATSSSKDDPQTRDVAGSFSGAPLRPYHNKLSDYTGVSALLEPNAFHVDRVFADPVRFTAQDRDCCVVLDLHSRYASRR